MRSIIHKKQAARMEYKKLESTAIVHPSTLALYPAIAVENQLDSVKKLEPNANVRPSSLALLSGAAIEDQLDSVRNLPKYLQ